MRSWHLVAPLTALGLASASSTGHAEPRLVALRIECPALDQETRAVVEGRAQADLAAARLPAGEVAILCGATSATIVWTPQEGLRRQRRVDFRGELGDIDDAILEGVYGLVFTDIRPEAPPKPIVEPVVPHDVPVTMAPPEQVAPAHRIHVAGLAGVDAELWHGGIAGEAGADAGVVVSPWDRWSLGVAVAPQWGLGGTSGLGAWGLRGYARVDYDVIAGLWLGVGVGMRSLWVNGAGTKPSQLEGITGGAMLSARYLFTLGPIDLSAGPRLEVLARPIAVDVAGSEAFRVPTVVAGVAIDGAAPAWPRER